MNTIKCAHCGKDVEIDKALEGQTEALVYEDLQGITCRALPTIKSLELDSGE